MAEHSYDQVMTALRNADAAGDTEAATRLASIAKGLSQPVQEPVKPETNYLQDFAKGAVGTGAAVMDLAAGLPKTLGATLAAPVMTALGGDPEGSRQKAQQVAEDIIGTPSKGLLQMGVPEEYINNLGYQAPMKPFEALSHGVEWLGDKAADLTGRKDVGGVVKQVADIGMLAAPLPGLKAFKDRYMKAAHVDTSSKAKINPLDDVKLQEEIAAEVKGKEFRRQAAEQHNAETSKVDAELRAQELRDLDAQMMQYPQDLQAPQFGMGGKIAKVEDQVGRAEKAKLEPGERTTQTEMDLEQQRLSVENKQREIDTAWAEHAKQEPTLSREDAFAEQERLQKEQADLDTLRQQIAEEPLTLEPQQGTTTIESPQVRQTYRPRGERGSVNVGEILDGLETVFDRVKPKSLPEFIAAAKQAGLNTSDAVYDTMFQGKQGEAAAQQTVQKAVGIQAFNKKISPQLDRYNSPWKDRTPEEVVDIIKNLPDNTEKSLGAISNNLLSKGRLGVQRHLNEGVQAGVAFMSQLHENAKIEGNQLLNDAKSGINAIARKLETLTGHGEAHEVFKQIFEHQLDPDAHQFRLNERQQALLDSIKKTTDKIWDDFVSQVAKMSPEKAEILAKMKQDYYMPHQFFGDFVSYVRDADGKLLTFVAERTQAGAERAVQHLREQLGSEYKIDTPVYVGEKSRQLGKKAEAGRTGAAIQEGLAGQFDYMIDLLGSSDPAVQKAQSAVQRVINRRALSSEGMSNRRKANTNVGGFEGNKGWKTERENYFDAKDSLERYVNSFYDWKGNMQVADFLNQVKDTAPDKVNTYATLKTEFENTNGAPTASNALVTEAKNTFAKSGFSPSELTNGARWISNVLTVQALGFYNPVMLLQNFIQSPGTQLAQMANQFGHGANFNPAKAFGNILASTWDGMTMGKSNPKWAEYARSHEIGDPGLVTSHGKTKLGSAVKEYGASKSIAASEQVSRIGYFYGMTKNLMEIGYPEAKALEMAKNMTRDHMGNYENYAKPGAMTRLGIAGELAGRLQTYGVNAFTQFAQATADMGKGIKEMNPRLMVPFAMFVATQYLVGGMNGTIPLDVAEKLHWASVKSGVIPPEWRSPRQTMLEEYPKAAISPLSRATGVWTEGSFRSQTPLLSAPIPQKAVETLKEIPDALKWIADTYENKNRVSNLDKAQVLQAFFPTSVRGWIEKENLVNKSGVMVSKGTGRPMYKMGEHDQGLGSYTNLRSYARGRTSELSNLATEREMRITKAKQELEKSFGEKLAGAVGHGQKLTPDYVKATIKRDFELGGDVDQTMERALKFATEAGYPNQIVLQLIKSERNPFKMQRMNRSYQALQENTR